MNQSVLYSTVQIRTIEQVHGTVGLMEKAGLAAAELARELVGNGSRILVLAGPGNNGGDAFVTARHLQSWWYKVALVFTGEREKLPVDAAAAHDAWLLVGGVIATEIPSGRIDFVVDGLFGIGLVRSLEGRHAELIGKINALASPVLAIDIPSGLCADTGRVLGAAVEAAHTITFLARKPGLFTLDGPDHAGQVHLADLGVNVIAYEPAQGRLIDAPPALPARRRRNTHKGSHGSVGVLGGAESMAGAALLAGRAALLAGAGRVYAGLLTGNAPAVDCAQPELMLRDAKTLFDLDHLTALVIGPGLGRGSVAESSVQRALHYPAPLLLDADALAMLAGNDDLRWQLRERTAGATVLTPHPGEAATLLGCSSAEVQADRLASALKIAATYNAITVLKGCGSVIAVPDGRWYVNASGNPGMACAGMGDVLAGIIGGLSVQGMDLFDATLLGVYLHGAAADSLVADGVGPVGLTASEVALEARNLLNEWIYGSP